jgi:hypothetical protein
MAKKPLEVGQSNPPSPGVVRGVVGDVISIVDLVVGLTDDDGVDRVLLAVDDDPGTVHLIKCKQNSDQNDRKERLFIKY